jgi:hypothetical protein
MRLGSDVPQAWHEQNTSPKHSIRRGLGDALGTRLQMLLRTGIDLSSWPQSSDSGHGSCSSIPYSSESATPPPCNTLNHTPSTTPWASTLSCCCRVTPAARSRPASPTPTRRRRRSARRGRAMAGGHWLTAMEEHHRS